MFRFVGRKLSLDAILSSFSKMNEQLSTLIANENECVEANNDEIKNLEEVTIKRLRDSNNASEETIAKAIRIQSNISELIK